MTLLHLFMYLLLLAKIRRVDDDRITEIGFLTIRLLIIIGTGQKLLRQSPEDANQVDIIAADLTVIHMINHNQQCIIAVLTNATEEHRITAFQFPIHPYLVPVKNRKQGSISLQLNGAGQSSHPWTAYLEARETGILLRHRIDGDGMIIQHLLHRKNRLRKDFLGDGMAEPLYYLKNPSETVPAFDQISLIFIFIVLHFLIEPGHKLQFFTILFRFIPKRLLRIPVSLTKIATDCTYQKKQDEWKPVARIIKKLYPVSSFPIKRDAEGQDFHHGRHQTDTGSISTRHDDHKKKAYIDHTKLCTASGQSIQ